MNKGLKVPTRHLQDAIQNLYDHATLLGEYAMATDRSPETLGVIRRSRRYLTNAHYKIDSALNELLDRVSAQIGEKK